MDPNATLEIIRKALRDGDTETARASAADLADWVGRGGFPPSDPTWRKTLTEVAQPMRFMLTSTGNPGAADWLDLEGAQAETAAIARILDAMAPGEVISIKRIS